MAASAEVGKIKSVCADILSLVTFISRTRRRIAVYWIDYNGERVRYAVLNYSEQLQITTYVTHPWIFRDADTGDVLVTSRGDDVFFPVAWNGDNQHDVIIGIPGQCLR